MKYILIVIKFDLFFINYIGIYYISDNLLFFFFRIELFDNYVKVIIW